jgi:hypothetical protein
VKVSTVEKNKALIIICFLKTITTSRSSHQFSKQNTLRLTHVKEKHTRKKAKQNIHLISLFHSCVRCSIALSMEIGKETPQ